MKNICLITVLFIFMPICAWSADMYSVNSGATVQITEHGICQRITNSHALGRPIMVPTRTTTEWTTFRNNRPAGVAMVACPTGGTWTATSGMGCTTSPACTWSSNPNCTTIGAVCYMNYTLEGNHFGCGGPWATIKYVCQ